MFILTSTFNIVVYESE